VVDALAFTFPKISRMLIIRINAHSLSMLVAIEPFPADSGSPPLFFNCIFLPLSGC